MMSDPRNIRIDDYDYPLPPGLIAQYPLPNRDASRLLVYNKGKLSDTLFTQLPNLLPSPGLLVFNDSRVIRARFAFHKSSGARIEIFCLEPIAPTGNLQQAFSATSESHWKCYIGNLKKWKEGKLHLDISVKGKKLSLVAEKAGYQKDTISVKFAWNNPDLTFSEIMDAAGHIPLPPYINRNDEEIDASRYQTIFASEQGSVAAPTAGLHFTEKIMEALHHKGVASKRLTLHVGAGTFKPVSSDNIGAHDMHHEFYSVTRDLIAYLINHDSKPLIPVGTTSMRTLESLYWLGLKLAISRTAVSLNTGQWDPYEKHPEISRQSALKALLKYLDSLQLDVLHAATELIIVPGYRFRLCSGLITNFHLPKSTLLLLVAALMGQDWEKAYQYAIDKNFRFLSYGDSCLFIP